MKKVTISETNKYDDDESVVFYSKLSEALDNEQVACGVCDFDCKYFNYLTGEFTINYARLSLISRCHEMDIEPMDVLDGSRDYYVYIAHDDFMHRSIFTVISPLHKQIIDQNDINHNFTSKLSNIYKLVGETCKVEHERELIQSQIKGQLIKSNSLLKRANRK